MAEFIENRLPESVLSEEEAAEIANDLVAAALREGRKVQNGQKDAILHDLLYFAG